MELLSYALLKPLVPFLTVFVLVAIGWTLSEAASRRLVGTERPIWAFAILVFPPLGSLFYDLFGKKNTTETATETEIG